jgi:two-component system, LytTR family, sensor kinase
VINKTNTYKPIATIRITAIVTLVIGLLFPFLFFYINNGVTVDTLIKELLLTPVKLAAISTVIYLLIQVNNRSIGKTRVSALRYLVELPLSALLIFFWLDWFLRFVEWPAVYSGPFSTQSWYYRQNIGLFLAVTVFIYVFQSGLNFYKLAQEKAAEAEQLERAHAQTRLQALKNQVNPHFLFNSLSVLSSLVQVSAETSDHFIQHLSKAYRYILDQKEVDWVTLKAELEFLDAYFFLLQIRFDKKIRLEKRITMDPEQYTLPPLSLQLLVENAVKHNRMSNNEPLFIRIHTEDASLVMTNNINKREQHEDSTGIGLENIRSRYAYITDSKIEITHTDAEFRVRIPLIKNTGI